MPPRPKHLKTWAGFIAICLAAFLAIALIARHIYDYIPNSEDEAAYLFQAQVFAQNRLTVPTPPTPDAFWSPFVIDHEGRRFGKYPPGWPLLLSGGVRLGLPWLVNGGLALLTLALIARLGRAFYPRFVQSSVQSSVQLPVGLWAAALALVTPGFLFLSSSLLSHTASLFWTTLALWLLYRSLTAVRPWLYALPTGAALGVIFLTRPFAALGIGLAIGLFLFILSLRREAPATIFIWLILGGLPLVMLLPLYWAATSGDLTLNPYLLVWPYDRVGFGPDIGPYGYTLSNALFINTRLKLQALASGLYGWPGWSNLLFIPLPFLSKTANRWDWLLLGTLFGLIVIHIFYWAFGGVDGGFPRYYYDALPALLLLTIRGLETAVTYVRRPAAASVWGRWLPHLPAALVAGFVLYSLVWRFPPLLIAQKQKYGISTQPVEVVEQADISPPALILVKNVGGWHDFAASFATNDPTLDGPIIYAIDWGPTLTAQIRRQFSQRTCWELEDEHLRRCR